MSEFPETVDVDYTDGEGEDPADYPSLQHKIEKAIEVTRRGLEQYETPAVMWTGGKDSTLTLYFINEVAAEFGYEKPTAVFIDHYQHFEEITDFVEHWADEWGIDLVYARNDDVGEIVDEHGLEPGDDIAVDDLSAHNQRHVRSILEYEEDTLTSAMSGTRSGRSSFRRRSRHSPRDTSHRGLMTFLMALYRQTSRSHRSTSPGSDRSAAR